MSRTPRFVILGVLVFLAMAWGATSWGCPVCFGASDAPIVKGVEMSVLFMIGITYSLLFTGVAAVIVLRRRALRHAAGLADPSLDGTSESPKNERAATAPSLE